MQHILSTEQLQVTIKNHGAELCSVKNAHGLEFLWQAKEDVWPRHAPVLFPVVGKLKDNTFLFEGSPYSLNQHGFARDRHFILKEKTDTSCTFELTSDTESRKIYPFDFVFRVIYTLQDATLYTRYEVVNPSEIPLLFSIGAHPGFRCPLQANETFEDYYLEFEQADFNITALSNGLRKTNTSALSAKNNKLSLSKTLFENDALVFENNQINKISLRSIVSMHTITMDCPCWPYFGIWSKKGCEEFVCLEPWYGIADKESDNQDLTKKDGIVRLDAGKEFSCAFSITFN